ncbi:M20 family metallopeptidase [Haliscomenobacter sp.]|uniref:M20 metallopeptidase family protein n=1 Tax=Haliscomenobacter sp. TaxID=2717303 RepID=UPI003593415C
MTLKDNIQKLAQAYHPEIVALRRHIHQNPELSFEEHETGKYVAAQLQEWGIAHQTGVAGTGVVALIEGKNPGKNTVALRADMDALPIIEANEVPYKSQNPGVMHACGHDVHTASLLGAAKILQETRQDWEGSVKLIFQPAEERLPGGASLMIKEGVLQNPSPTAIAGQHVHPPLAAGKVGFRPGRYMGSCDELYITITGKGGHGAMPQDCVDPILLAAHMITALQQIVSRNNDPTIPTVLTFGKINSTGGATNIIPKEVKIEGTFRTMDETWRKEAHRRMKYMAEHLIEGMGGKIDFFIDVGYPCLLNDEALTLRMRESAEDYLGVENVVDLPVRLTAEDFSYYSQEMPACFYRLGTGNVERGITSPVHSDTFDIDEEALKVGAGLMAWLAVRELELTAS